MELGFIFLLPLAVVMGIFYGLMDVANAAAQRRADKAENNKLRRML